jgi:hypothetical protein
MGSGHFGTLASVHLIQVRQQIKNLFYLAWAGIEQEQLDRIFVQENSHDYEKNKRCDLIDH